MTRQTLAGLLAVLVPAGTSAAGFQLLFDKPSWEASVPSYTALTFKDIDPSEYVTDQYADLGVTFLNGDDYVEYSAIGYPQDGWGLHGNATIHLVFDFDIYAVGVWHPGYMGLKLYDDGQLVFSYPFFPGGGNNWFGGVVGDVPFDEVVIYDFFDSYVYADDIYFAPVPAPAAWLVVAAAMAGPCGGRGRRRRG